MAGCGCGKKTAYQINYPDGRKTTVNSMSEAITAARRVGGTYQKVKR